MPKYTISVPDANKPAIRISGVKLTSNPFKVLGRVKLQKTKTIGGMDNFTVFETDLESCFPFNEKFWNITDMFCNSCNRNIHDLGTWNRLTSEYLRLLHKSNFPIFSKHKINDEYWQILIYNPENELLDEPIDTLINKRQRKVELSIQ